MHRLRTAPEVGDWIKSCEDALLPGVDEEDTLKRVASVRVWRREYDRATKLPQRLVEEQSKTSSLAHEPWVEARKEGNFSKFAPWLEKLLKLSQEEADCVGYASSRYDALLDNYEPGATTALLNPVFADLQTQLTALLPQLRQRTAEIDPQRLKGTYPIAEQQAFNRKVAQAIGFDFEAGRIDTTVHPFCTCIGPMDHRLTTRYDEQDFTSALFGVMHEAGHGMYNQGIPPEHFGLPMGSAVSLGIHESQSRLWENQIGRSRLFWQHWYPVAQAHFPGLNGLSLEEFWLLINRVHPSFIRVEADEVTYNLHIILRFEIEQKMISGELPVSAVPEFWNSRFQQIFGFPVPDDTRGCLQDVHWAFGGFGYFPTYTLGNLNAAQLFASAQKQVPQLTEDFQAGRYDRLLGWLRKNIHEPAQRYLPNELMQRVTGETTQARYFLDYLKGKF
jgi:carboxypeptidase Taq